jgi:hypothetical protein
VFIMNTNIGMLWQESVAVCCITLARRFSVGPEEANEGIVRLTE